VRDRLPAAMKAFTTETVMRRSLVGYQRDEAAPMLRIYPPPAVRGATSRIVQAFQAELRCVCVCVYFGSNEAVPFNALTQSCSNLHRNDGVRMYETQFDATTRFSLDTGIRCGNWLEVALPAGTSRCTVIDEEEEEEEEEGDKCRQSHCNVELGGEWDAVAGHVTTCGGVPVQVHAFSKASQWGSLPPLRSMCLSIDRYPTSVPAHQWAETGDCPDPVRAISVILTIEDGSPSTHSKRRLVMLNAADLPPHLAAAGRAFYGPFTTRIYPSEAALLTAFHELVLSEDPSLLTGWEVGEALRVLLARAEALKLRGFGHLARRKGVQVVVKTMQMYR